MSVSKIIAGDGIAIDPVDGNGDVTVSTNGIMTVTNLKPSYQPTMLDFINNASQLVFIGDSITWGLSFNVDKKSGPAPYRWSTQLSQNYHKEEINLAIGGSTYSDQLPVFYNKWKISDKPNGPYFIACGVNDIVINPLKQDGVLTNALATAIYAALPSSCIKNLRINSNDVTLTGLWVNNPLYNNFGISCLSDGKKNNFGTLETTVIGRYIVINSTCTFPDFNILTVYIDNQKVDIFPLTRSLVGYFNNLDFKCWIFDTNSLVTVPQAPGTSHNVKLFINISMYSTVNIDFIAGFDNNQSDTNPIFMVPIYNIGNPVGVITRTYYLRKSYNEGLKQMCRMLRNVHNLPVYYMEDTTDSYNIYGNITSVGLEADILMDYTHPGKSGHTWIKNRMINFLENGEYIYRNTM